MATNSAANIVTAASGKILQGAGIGTAPSFSTATYPSTAGSSGNVLTSDGTNFTSSAAVSGSMVLISTQTASNSASLIFTGLTAYKNYLAIISAIVPQTNTANFQMLASDDAGSTYETTGYTSGFLYSLFSSTTVNNTNSTTYVAITGPSTNAGQTVNGFINMVTMNTAATPVSGVGQIFYYDSTLADRTWGTAGFSTPNAINAVKFQFSSGNIVSGNISMYGIIN